MTGTLQIKKGKYYCVLDYRNEEGARKFKWISTGLEVKNNKRKASEILKDLLAEYEKKLEKVNVDKNSNIPFTDYLINWVEKKKNKIELTTWESYYNIVANHFIPYFKPLNLSIEDVKPKHISDYYDYKFSNGRLDRKKGGLSFGSLKKHSAVLKSALNQAFLEEIINRNPAAKIPLPKKDCGEHKYTFLTVTQANELLKIFKDHHIQPIIYMALYYGLRRGEVIGLKWSAIDFKNNVLKINHIITQTLTLTAKDRTKTSSGKRDYILIPEIKEMLNLVKKKQNDSKKIFGKNYKKTDYVFTWPDGRPYSPSYITKEFQKVLHRNNFPKMCFHDLRHSCASVLHDKGWDLKDIQTWLGHADIQTTANIYTHISDSRRNQMAKNIQNTFKI